MKANVAPKNKEQVLAKEIEITEKQIKIYTQEC
jgi:hypothetical protein